MMCKIEPERKHCTLMCERTLDCRHQCKNLCAEPCTNKKCEEIILQKISPLACGHNKVWVLCCDKYKGNIFIPFYEPKLFCLSCGFYDHISNGVQAIYRKKVPIVFVIIEINLIKCL